jgi:hypothetical protein
MTGSDEAVAMPYPSTDEWAAAAVAAMLARVLKAVRSEYMRRLGELP